MGGAESGSSTEPVLIVGLGNPGIEYQFTPHNAGFLAVDRIAEQCNASIVNRRGKALTASAHLAGRRALLAKPETYMNLSGLAVAALVRDLEIDPARSLIVISPWWPRLSTSSFKITSITLSQSCTARRWPARPHRRRCVGSRSCRLRIRG